VTKLPFETNRLSWRLHLKIIQIKNQKMNDYNNVLRILKANLLIIRENLARLIIRLLPNYKMPKIVFRILKRNCKIGRRNTTWINLIDS